MRKQKRFEIIIGSPIDYGELVAYINIMGQDIALLNQDEGPNNLKLEFFEEIINSKFDYEIFLEALQAAKNELMLDS